MALRLGGLRRARIAFDRDLTLGVLMERLAKVDPDRVLVDELGGRRLTVGEAAEQVERWASAIRSRAAPREVVVVAVPNGYDQFLLCLAASRAGCLPAPVNDRMRPEEIDHVVADAGAPLVIRSPDDLPRAVGLTAAHHMDVRDVGALFYTSGTTGRPKGAELSHKGLLGSLSNAALVPSGFRDDEAVFSLPMAHIMGFLIASATACAGIPVRFVPRFDAGVLLDELEERRSSIFVGVPAMYRMLLEAGAEERDLSSVRLWISGADAMPAELSDKFVNMGAFASLPWVGSVGRAAFAEGYGMVETAGSGALRVSLPFLPDAVSRVGIPSPGYHTKVVGEDGRTVRRGEVGELLLSGPGLLKGYRGDEEATDAVLDEEGWLRTGDLVRRGPFGAFTFEGRAKDIIVRGGYNVYAVEVEQALERHPAVVEAAVVGLPDDRLGEIPVAAVTLASATTATGEEIRAWAKEQLSSYKVPVRVQVVDELPHSGTRKVQRAEVRALFQDDPPPS